MAVHEVKAHGKGKTKRQLDEIRVKRAANGFAIHKRYTGGENPYMEREEPPAVFNSHNKAHAHLKTAMAEMHPPGSASSAPDADADGEGQEPMSE